MTRDVLPAESNYRNLLSLGRQNSEDVSRKFSRPTLDELHDENGDVKEKTVESDAVTSNGEDSDSDSESVQVLRICA